jgi:drug/metabolite transporter (DMT)-like permease
MRRSILTGTIYIILAFLANTTQSVFGKYVDKSLSVEMFSFGTFLVAFILLLPIILFRKGRDIPTSKGRYHLLRAVTGITGFLLFIAAAQLTSLVDTNVLVNTTPIFIPILALIFLHQHIPRAVWIAIMIGFVGVVVIVRPDASIFSNPGNLVALGAGLVTAIEFLAVNHLDQTESPLTQLFYFLLFGIVVLGLISIGKFNSAPAWAYWMMLGTGLCLLAFQFLLIKAYQFAKPHEIGAFQYISVVFAAIYGVVLFKETIQLETIIGAILVCVGGVISITGSRDKSVPKTVS